MVTIISEAYSASNLGDRELVLETTRIIRERDPGATLELMAVDPESFLPFAADFSVSERLFPRLQYLHASRLKRCRIFLQWAFRMFALSSIAVLPWRSLRGALARRFPNAAVRSISRADSIVAVGGGYLGDQYAKEVVLTSWTWWFAGRLGVSVETMPVSIELSRGRLGRVFAFLSRDVRLRVRDEASQRRAQSLGLRAELLPDLAFLNARVEFGAPREVPPCVALVGSDYLSSSEVESLILNLTAVFAETSVSDVSIISMHSSMDGTAVGGDEAAAELLKSTLAKRGIKSECKTFESYLDLCEYLSGAPFLVSARMHAGIAGLCSGTKVGLLAYEEKHFALMADMGILGQVVPITCGLEELRRMILSLMSDATTSARSASVERAQELAKSLGVRPPHDFGGSLALLGDS